MIPTKVHHDQAGLCPRPRFRTKIVDYSPTPTGLVLPVSTMSGSQWSPCSAIEIWNLVYSLVVVNVAVRLLCAMKMHIEQIINNLLQLRL